MSKKDRRKLEKKRRAERRQQAKRAMQFVKVEPYHGKKYKTAAYVPPIFHAELGILQADLISRRELTDQEVISALRRLAIAMSRGMPGPLPPDSEDHCVIEDMEGLVIWRIRENWRHLFCETPPLSEEELIGVIRTILGSIEIRRWINPSVRAYLDFLDEFMAEITAQCSASE